MNIFLSFIKYQKYWLLVLVLFCYTKGFSTHNRAGSIAYTHISGYTYNITITTFTRIGGGVEADSDTLYIDWGQGGVMTGIPRTFKEELPNTGGTIQINVFTSTYTFTGPGRYVMVVVDPNRNAGILNIPNSVDRVFCIKSELRIDPWGGLNSSVQFKNKAVEFICDKKPWFYNPGAYDLDGDSLVYSLVPNLGERGRPLPGYVLPHEVDQLGNTFTIDSITGDIFWDKPVLVGEYNIAVLVEEYDRKTGIKRGEILRDIQLTVNPCKGDPPYIVGTVDTCIEAGDTLNMKITSFDPDKDSVILKYSGTPFELKTNPATFTYCQIGNKKFNSCGYLNWKTSCENIRKMPFPVFFTATENKSLGYTSFKRMNIRVVGPPPLNPVAQPKGSEINLSWKKPRCANVKGYNIYHRIDSTGFVPGYCEIGVPESTGYKLVGTTNGLESTSFIHKDVLFGQRMCYLITAIYEGDIEGYASEEFCTFLKKDVPIITNVSVNLTSPSTGSDSLKWTNPTEVDTLVAFPGPYYYKIYSGVGFNDASNLVFTTPQSIELWKTQTSFRHNDINTNDNANCYKIEFYSGQFLVGTSQLNSSIFLTLIPDDRQILLKWESNVGWLQDKYVIYRKKKGELNFQILDTTVQNSYLDKGLNNTDTFCYFVKSYGRYLLDGMPSPLINYSQEACESPVDLTPPCPPVLAVTPSCDDANNYLTWSISEDCASDVELYNIYYRPTNEGPFSKIQTLYGKNNRELYHALENSIAGCYYVTAVDGINDLGNQNESEPSNIVCVDNCPEYELPNVFTPNGDGVNDLYIPIKNKFIESVDFIVYDRWGGEVFRTKDPRLLWDGKLRNEHLQNKTPGTDGVYFYVCRFNANTLNGIKSDELKGFIHMFYGEKKGSFKD